ncbi:MAG: hypothetical protein UH824_00025 [Acutalibacteraceae bacterium]|nr:hypothetical protein [Acutalibacteraceae bacterium]
MADKIKDFNALLEQSGIPFRYFEWKTKPKAFPFGAFVFVSRTALKADGGNYYSTDRMRVELYCDKKDIAAENALEAVLTKTALFTKNRKNTFPMKKCLKLYMKRRYDLWQLQKTK